MSTKSQLYLLRALVIFYILYSAIAAFGEHKDYFRLLGNICMGWVLFRAGRSDKAIEEELKK